MTAPVPIQSAISSTPFMAAWASFTLAQVFPASRAAVFTTGRGPGYPRPWPVRRKLKEPLTARGIWMK